MWVVDTCIIVDLLMDQDGYGKAAGQLLRELLPDGLTISPVTMVELAPAFAGNLDAQKKFLDIACISFVEAQSALDTAAAHTAWHAFVKVRRGEGIPKRPIADILIGGFAVNRSGLVTRNIKDFKRWFPGMKIIDPMSPRR